MAEERFKVRSSPARSGSQRWSRLAKRAVIPLLVRSRPVRAAAFSRRHWRLLVLGVALVATALAMPVALYHRPPNPQEAFANHLNEHGIRLGWKTNYIGKSVCDDLRKGITVPAEERQVQLEHLDAQRLDTASYTVDAAAPPDASRQIVHWAITDLCPSEARNH
jgi:hypothetical protein